MFQATKGNLSFNPCQSNAVELLYKLKKILFTFEKHILFDFMNHWYVLVYDVTLSHASGRSWLKMTEDMLLIEKKANEHDYSLHFP